MGTISEKLVYLNGTKQAIKQAINEDFEVIDDNTTFREYAEEISSNNAKYKDLIPKEKTNATNTLDISNSSGLDKTLVTQYGNTYQETTTGKNLLNDYDLASRYHISSVEGNLLTTTSSSSNYDTFQPLTKTQTIQLNQGTEYYVSLDMRLKSGTYSNPLGGINLINLNGSSLSTNTEISNSSMTSNFQRYCYKCTASLTTNERIGIMIQLRAGASNAVFEIKNIMISTSSDTTYEKYTGENPAPNPDYPQTITNVTGTNTIKIVGKNLFDKNNVRDGYRLTQDGYYAEAGYSATEIINVKPNTTYSTSWTMFLGACVCTYDKNDNFSRRIQNGTSFTTTSTEYYIRACVENNMLSTAQIEKSPTATTYEAYKEKSYTINLGDIELCKIDTYKDRIYPLNGKWYLEKNIGKVVLNGSESWSGGSSATTSTNYTYLYSNVYDNLILENNYNAYCNNFANLGKDMGGGTSVSTDTISIGYTGTYRIRLMILTSRLGTQSVAGFKTWLSTHNTTVYYILNTPTTEEITENNYPTLYNQLNNIKLFEGVNHITMTNESGLDVEFDITYYKDWKLD